MSFSQLDLIVQNRLPHEEKAGVRYATLQSAVDEFKARMDRIFALEDQVSRCTCAAADPGFEISARHNAAPYRILEELAIQRMQERV